MEEKLIEHNRILLMYKIKNTADDKKEVVSHAIASYCILLEMILESKNELEFGLALKILVRHQQAMLEDLTFLASYVVALDKLIDIGLAEGLRPR